MGKKEDRREKPTPILVNTGRGVVVDREAFLSALKERKIMDAGLDVFHQKRLPPDAPIRSAMASRGGVENVEHFLAGKATDLVVSPAR